MFLDLRQRREQEAERSKNGWPGEVIFQHRAENGHRTLLIHGIVSAFEPELSPESQNVRPRKHLSEGAIALPEQDCHDGRGDRAV
jgi:hypothetical protein